MPIIKYGRNARRQLLCPTVSFCFSGITLCCSEKRDEIIYRKQFTRSAVLVVYGLNDQSCAGGGMPVLCVYKIYCVWYIYMYSSLSPHADRIAMYYICNILPGTVTQRFYDTHNIICLILYFKSAFVLRSNTKKYECLLRSFSREPRSFGGLFLFLWNAYDRTCVSPNSGFDDAAPRGYYNIYILYGHYFILFFVIDN